MVLHTFETNRIQMLYKQAIFCLYWIHTRILLSSTESQYVVKANMDATEQQVIVLLDRRELKALLARCNQSCVKKSAAIFNAL